MITCGCVHRDAFDCHNIRYHIDPFGDDRDDQECYCACHEAESEVEEESND